MWIVSHCPEECRPGQSNGCECSHQECNRRGERRRKPGVLPIPRVRHELEYLAGKVSLQALPRLKIIEGGGYRTGRTRVRCWRRIRPAARGGTQGVGKVRNVGLDLRRWPSTGPGPGPAPAQWLTACKVTALLPARSAQPGGSATSDTPTLGAGLPCLYRSIRAAKTEG